MIIEQIGLKHKDKTPSVPVIGVMMDFLGFPFGPVEEFELNTHDNKSASQRRIAIATMLANTSKMTMLKERALIAESTLLRQHLDNVNYTYDKKAAALNLYEENARLNTGKVVRTATKTYSTLSN